MWQSVALGAAQTGLSYLDSRQRAKEAKAQRKRIDKLKQNNIQDMRTLEIDARAAQDWAANQIMKNRNNREGANAIANMFSQKINNASQGISELRRENVQLEASKPKVESWQSSLLGSAGLGFLSGMSTYMGTDKLKLPE